MGCGPSKIEQEETVARCKDRKKFMRDALMGRNALATAHSAYAMSLKNTGAALSDYAQGECVIPDIHRPQQNMGKIIINHPNDKILPPPPVPVPESQTVSPLQKSSSAPLVARSKNKGKAPMVDASIQEEEDDNEDSIHSKRMDNLPVPPPIPSPSMHGLNGIDTVEYWFQGSMPPPTLGTGDEIEIPPPPSPPTPPPPPPPPPPKMYYRKWEGKKGRVLAMPPPPPSVSLLQVLNQLDDHFLMASDSAHNVSKNLEAVRMHYHSNFADKKGYIDHSARVLRVITWNESLSEDEDENADDDFDKDEWETLATTLDKLFAWEKKLYDEIKEAELMRMAYHEQLDLLNKKKKRGAGTGSLQRLKAVVSHLHTKYVVAVQSVESTLSEIDRLRDSQLYPKLVDLVEGMGKMWDEMYQHHHKQLETISELRSYEIISTSEETTEQHHDRTVQLFEIVREWHNQLHKLTSRQKEYVNALTSWLTLNLIKIDTSLKENFGTGDHDENESASQLNELPIEKLLRAWNARLEKLQDELALTAISTFSEAIHTIITLQRDELKLKIRCETSRKELEKKRRQFEDWQRKYLEKQYSNPKPSRAPSDPLQDPLEERRAIVDALEKRWREEKENYEKQCKIVREKTIVSLRNNLPVLFRTMMEFSLASFVMYNELFSITQIEEQQKEQEQVEEDQRGTDP